ncbi:hypothetical protein Q3G72_029011 [Acer saccharum]|nr:hypothetical protein Q3G72_029011 [Acer saccharum]
MAGAAGGLSGLSRCSLKLHDKGDQVDKRGYNFRESQQRDKSFAEAVKGDLKKEINRTKDVEREKNMLVWEKSHVVESWISKCAIGILREFMNISYVNRRLSNRGFSFSSSYLGDLKVLWSFDTEQESTRFIKNRFYWDDCFYSMGKWTTSDAAKSRLAWINSMEVPLNCWNDAFFFKLGEIIVVMEEDLSLVNRSWLVGSLGLTIVASKEWKGAEDRSKKRVNFFHNEHNLEDSISLACDVRTCNSLSVTDFKEGMISNSQLLWGEISNKDGIVICEGTTSGSSKGLMGRASALEKGILRSPLDPPRVGIVALRNNNLVGSDSSFDKGIFSGSSDSPAVFWNGEKMINASGYSGDELFRKVEVVSLSFKVLDRGLAVASRSISKKRRGR